MHGMYQGKKILIACSMIEDEINAVFDHFGWREGITMILMSSAK